MIDKMMDEITVEIRAPKDTRASDREVAEVVKGAILVIEEALSTPGILPKGWYAEVGQ
jgi:hypothetical protein